MSIDAPSENFSLMEYDESVSVEIGNEHILENEDRESDDIIILESNINGIVSSSKPVNEDNSNHEIPSDWSHHENIIGESVLSTDLVSPPLENLLIEKCEEDHNKEDTNIMKSDLIENLQSEIENKNGSLELTTESDEWSQSICGIGESVISAKLETEQVLEDEEEEVVEDEQIEQVENVVEDEGDTVLENNSQMIESNKSENEEEEAETPELAAAWSEPGCIICNVDIPVVSKDEKTAAQKKEQYKLKMFFIEVMAVGKDIRLEDEDFFPFCRSCSQEVGHLMAVGYKIDFMHRQFDKARDLLATKCVKTFILRTKPELIEEDEEIMALPHKDRKNKTTNRERVLDGWKRRYEVVQPGPKNPVMIRSMDSRGRVTVVRINSKGEAILPPERFPKRGGVDVGRMKHWEEEPEETEEITPHVGTANVYECRDCHKTFTSKAMLTYHSRIHSGELPFECEVCGRGFAVPHYLITHMRCHTGEKPYKCQECGKGFAQRGGLATHALVHTGAKPYVCDECGKSFRQKYHLTQHLLIHSGIKPFPCEICGKSFNVKMNLREHMRRHTGDRPYKCPYCTVVGFFRKKMLREHITKTHPQRSLPEELLESSGINIPVESILPIDIVDEDEDLSDSQVTIPDDETECMDISTDDSNRELKFSV